MRRWFVLEGEPGESMTPPGAGTWEPDQPNRSHPESRLGLGGAAGAQWQRLSERQTSRGVWPSPSGSCRGLPPVEVAPGPLADLLGRLFGRMVLAG